MENRQLEAIHAQIQGLISLHNEHVAEIVVLRALVLELARQSTDFESLKMRFLDSTSHFAMKDLLSGEDKALRSYLEKSSVSLRSLLETLGKDISAGDK